METLTNGILTIAVKDHGAELASLVHAGREYLWQADKAFWQRHSPVLFPFVGSVWQGVYQAKGQTYRMGQHGFARDMDFCLVEKTGSTIRYRLQSSPETLGRYPYEFVLEISYELIDNCVRVHWMVHNPADEVLPFSIGAHPAFYWPMLTDAEIAGGVKAMEPALAATDRRGYFRIESSSPTVPMLHITEGGCFGAEDEMTLPPDGYMPLQTSTFDHDALVFDQGKIKAVTLCDDDRRPYLSLSFDTPLVGLWSPPGRRAPFVCIEPWYGCADTVGFAADISTKKAIRTLAPHHTFTAHYDILIHPRH